MAQNVGLGVVVPAGVVDAVRELTGVATLGTTHATVGGFSNLSFHAHLNGRYAVVKAATLPLKRDDLRREAKLLGFLESHVDMALPTPRVVAHGDHGDWTVTVLDEVPGENGLTFLGKRSLGYVQKRCVVLARLLQAIHHVAAQPANDPTFEIPVRVADLRSFVGDELFAEGVSEQMLAALESRAIGRGISLVHGDFGMHNVMWDVDGRRIRVGGLLDWEFGGWGSPLTDVAWLWWTFQFRGIADEFWPSFVEAYGAWALRAMGFESTAILDLVRVQMIQLLSRTERESASRVEWLKRWDALSTMALPTLPANLP
jgi:aminoglycoside phosphotransferase (APT) family kinase protein